MKRLKVTIYIFQTIQAIRMMIEMNHFLLQALAHFTMFHVNSYHGIRSDFGRDLILEKLCKRIKRNAQKISQKSFAHLSTIVIAQSLQIN